MGKKKVPDRWFDYCPMKMPIFDARIIPVKTPLPMPEHQWTPSDVMYNIPNVGLVIDTTFKRPPYYDPYEFTRNGIAYEKILCEGHNIPNQQVYDRFCEVVFGFLNANRMNDRVIVLHCTHGVNRTGYLLCRYLIERLGYSPDRALHTFAMSRGHPLERENYKQALYNLVARGRL